MSPEHNPYATPVSDDAEQVAQQAIARRILTAVRVTLFTMLWTVLFFFGSAILIGMLSGLYFVATYSPGAQPVQPSPAIGMIWAFVPMCLGVVGFALGVLGFLPGTRR